ncbi:MAG: hypothetical protein KAX28_01120 [Candidatus Marinimicrobia bacterium]|nr:hypothetical protein [Candidatus Neomarinimicrobiota bacterium]
MERTFDAGTIDLSKRKIVGGTVDKKIKDISLQLNCFRKEIDFWFTLLLKNQNPMERFYIRMPLCIGLFEYSRYLKLIFKLINESCTKINEIFEDKGRESPIILLKRSLKKSINSVINKLKDPRNQLAAHRFTIKKKNKEEFIFITDIFSHLNRLSIEDLSRIKEILFNCHDEINSWIAKYKTFLIIAK